ncbi:MAG: hypothetical protein H6563_10755 [Lewinellaceae bacterium]|nr:hypothetical protein [Lewinellaceae bacterium]
MRLPLRFPLFFFALILFSCQNKGPATTQTSLTDAQKAEQEARRQEIMDLHNAVMPQTAVVNRLSRQIKGFLQAESQAGREDENRQEALVEVIKRLNEADEAMYDWMGKFINNLDMLRESMDHQAVMNYLDGELVKIRDIDTLTQSSIERARAAMEKYGINQSEDK